MSQKITKIRDDILMALLPDVPFSGWTDTALKQAVAAAGYDAGTELAVFPSGMADVVAHFADWVDRQMLATLNTQTYPDKVRERIKQAVWARIHILNEHREAEKLALAYWARPFRKYQGMKILWRTADVIWTWAGDRSDDYNHYTKRTLLAGVMASTMLCLVGDTSTGLSTTQEFLDRRIENVMQFGGMIAKVKSFVSHRS